MGLSYSRMRYVEFTTSMPQEVLIGCHQRAFEYFGGLPETILYDSMKQVRLGPRGGCTRSWSTLRPTTASS